MPRTARVLEHAPGGMATTPRKASVSVPTFSTKTLQQKKRMEASFIRSTWISCSHAMSVCLRPAATSDR